jgi:hypothetical protein
MAVDLIAGYDLIIQSHVALVYRAIPSTRGDSPLHFSDECVAASRAAMEGYNAAWDRYRSNNDEMTWKMMANWYDEENKVSPSLRSNWLIYG